MDFSGKHRDLIAIGACNGKSGPLSTRDRC